ncbi:MAG: trypsin-like peptidase domain-containing protein [Clostridia bacterium]|nr:trypsin-like peptidase domain-containing protein [Clostridia bacterium]
MKKKIISLALVIVMTLATLTSCMAIDFSGMLTPDEEKTPQINNIYVEGGPTYGDINITSTAEKNLLAASKAVLSTVSIFTSSSAGSGVIYELDKSKGDAIVITNFHVVYNSEKNQIDSEILLFLYGMEHMDYAIEAEYLGGSINYDIAILKVSSSPVLVTSNARAVDVADSNKVSILETAIAVGNPEASGISATVGSISVDSEPITIAFEVKGETVVVELRVMRTDAAVNGGNSGGGLFNDKGELIGIVNARSSDTESHNIGYAIPSNVAVAIAENVKYYSERGSYKVHKCMLGITVTVSKMSSKYDETTGKLEKLETVSVMELSATSGAKGYLREGDVINSITIDGVTHRVTRMYHVVDAMLYARVGSTVTLNITRGGITRDVTIPITQSLLTDADKGIFD